MLLANNNIASVTEGNRDRELVVHTSGKTAVVRDALLHTEGVTTVAVRKSDTDVEGIVRYDKTLTPSEQAEKLISALVQRTR